MKQAIILRTDLKMSKGKLAGQAAHAAVASYKNAGFFTRRKWFKNSQTKIVLKVGSEEELLDLIIKAQKNDVKFSAIKDKGMTQIPPDTLTGIALGPDRAEKIDNITGDLKLL
jgi:PTH2 family peptidyl-tRNA hydrolase